MAFVLVLLCVFTFSVIAVLLHSCGTKKKLNLPPGPTGLPLLGYLPWIPTRFAKQQDVFSRLRRTYGSILSVRVGNTLAIVISDYTLIQQAFSNPDLLGRHNQHPTDVIPSGSYGISKSTGEKWQRHRRFFLRKLHDFGIGTTSFDKVVKEQVEIWIGKLEQCARSGQPCEISNTLNILILNSLWGLLCNERFDCEDKITHQMLSDFAVVIDLMTSSYMFTSLPKWLQKMVKLVNRKRIGDYEKTWTQLFTFFENFVKGRPDMNHIQDSGKDFLSDYMKEMEICNRNSNEELLTEYDLILLIMEIFIAGNDSTSAAIKWIIVCLARDQELQKAVQKQLDEVVGPGNELTLNDRKRLPLLSAAISETQRTLGSPLLSLEHVALEDTKIGGYDIPKGATFTATLNQFTATLLSGLPERILTR